MPQITKTIKLDVSKPNQLDTIIAKQYDSNSRFLTATLYDNGTLLKVSQDDTVTINAKRSDDSSKSFTGTVNEDGTVTVPLTYWMLSCYGTVICDISILSSDGETVLTTTSFRLTVQEKANGDDTISDSDSYELLAQLIAQVQGVLNADSTDTSEQIAAAVSAYMEEHAITAESLGALTAEDLTQALTEAKENGEFNGADGVGVAKFEQTASSTESGGANVWTVTLSDGSTYDLTVYNGQKGEKGDSYELTAEDKTEIANTVLSMVTNGDEVSY